MDSDRAAAQPRGGPTAGAGARLARRRIVNVIAAEAVPRSYEPGAPAGVRVPWRETLHAAFLLAAFLALAYGNVLFRGRSLVYSNNYNPLQPRASEASYGPGYTPHRKWYGKNLLLHANLHDPGGAWWQWEPGGQFLRRALERGELPFWDPYVGAGTPAMANVVPALLFPPYVLRVALGDGVLVKNLYALAMLHAAGLFTFLLLRKHGLGFTAALFGGAAYVFSAALAQNPGSFLGQTAACLPPALFLTRRFLDRPSAGRTAALAVGYGTISLASFPPILLGLFALAGAYGLTMALLPETARRAGLARRWIVLRFGAAALLSFGLTAFFHLPFLALVGDVPHVRTAYADGGLVSYPLVCLYQLLSPVLAGGAKVFADPPMPDPFFLQIPYLGAVPCLLALLARREGAGSNRALLPFLLAAALIVAGKLFGVAPVQWIGLVPGLRQVHFAPYFGVILDFLLALLAAVGLESVMRGAVTPRRVGAVAAVGGLAVLGLWQLAVENRVLDHPKAETWILRWALLAALVTVVSVSLLRVARGRSAAPMRGPVRLLLCLFVLEALINTVYPRQRAWDVWRHPVPYVRALQAEASLGRVFAVDAFNANAGSAFEVMSLDSLMPYNSSRVYRLYHRYANSDTPFFLREANRLPPEGVLDRANVELIALSRGRPELVVAARARGYAAIYADDSVEVFRRQSSPRYFFTSDYKVLRGTAAVRALGRMPAGRTVLLEEAPSFPPRPSRPGDPPVVVESFRRNRYRLSLEAPRPGLVYAAESNLPGWTARVNGRAVPILAANFAFRAVEVPAGRVEIELSYWPPGLTAGLAVSAAALAALAVWLVFGRSPRARHAVGSDAPPGESR